MLKLSASRTWAALAIALSVAVASAQDAKRSAEDILKDLGAAKVPAFDQSKQRDQAYFQEYVKQMRDAQEKRGTLILELYKVAPDHETLVTLLPERWNSSPPTGPQADEVAKEIESILAHAKSAKLKLEAAFFKARLALNKNRGNANEAMPAIDAFLKMAPKDERGGQLLYMASMYTNDKAKKEAIEDRILTEAPDSRYAPMIKGARRQREGIGKPFDLEFEDAIKGTTVSMKDLKGKVVVVDFWATWCGPCVAEMPTMKKLYAEYKEKGVEFIGVSLDQPKEQGGLDKLKTFVADKEITWPQYYQGNFWDSEFSRNWGINSIPCVFVVDGDGKLYSTEARGKLETLIPELLKKKADAAGAGGQ